MIQFTLIVGNITLSGTNWETDRIKLYVVLTNKTHPVIECYQHHNLYRRFEINKKQCSNHLPIRTLGTVVRNSNMCRKFAFKKADCKKLNHAIEENAFKPFYFSNVDAFLNQWNTWIKHHINNNIPKVTKHRAALPPWASKETSYMMKQLNTKKA